jgi:aryl-alcohol dehydrogenase-like predicted oxidoreductase/predicted kinase
VHLPARFGLGTMRLATDRDRDEARARETIHAALDAGLVVFDTARAYAWDASELGLGERWLGAALAAHRDGAHAFVMTKGGMARPDGQWRADGRAATLRADCEASLRALGRAIDLYFVHAPDPRVSWATTVRALARLQDDKLVRAIGVSNVSLAQLDEALALAPIAAVQLSLSLVDDLPLRAGLVARCRERGLMLAAHSPLGGPRRARKLLADPLLVDVAQQHGVAPAALALAALADAHACVLTIAGARRPEAVRALARAAAVSLGDDERARLAARFPALCAVPVAPVSTRPGEVVLIMGLPGAGKSAAVEAWRAAGYERLNRDELGGTLVQLAARLDERLAAGARRLVLDNTYVTRAQRGQVLAVAARHAIAVRGIWLDVPPVEAQVNIVWRMLDAHRRLLTPDELRRGKDNTALAPTALLRMQRALEAPAVDEGFAALEQPPFVRRPRCDAERPARFIAHNLFSTLSTEEQRHAFVFGWAPDAAPTLEAELRVRAADVALCRHGGGPPVCWCRPPLPGLLLALAHAHRLDLGRSEVVGQGRAHEALAAAVGARFVASSMNT